MITDYGIKGLLFKSLVATPLSNGLNQIARQVSSELPAGSSEKLDFLGAVPTIREWLGQRQPGKPNFFEYAIRNKKFESSMQIPLDWVRNDKTGQVAQRTGELTGRIPQWITKLVATLINNAETGLCFDGQAFFSASHSWGDSGTIVNLATYHNTGNTTPTANTCADAIAAALTAMWGMLDDRGEPINEDIDAVVLVVPLALSAVVRTAITAKQLDTGAGMRDNPLNGYNVKFTLVTSPRITTTARMDMYNATGNAVPYVFQENNGERMVTSKGAGSDFEHDEDAWEFGLKLVGNAGYGRFTDAYRTIFAT